ncbi:hypothetical protein E9229_001110 [Paeniglutamicibacter cryotolerans]|uniref:Uncharacterized protein n=1 Tax=Paeniglutamicibacter cryotolerans TaxID=670079 RepID=A0A839QFK1_9MICC|nr:hypothetical protein [Paeniglutamicibacter cryotolerans]
MGLPVRCRTGRPIFSAYLGSRKRFMPAGLRSLNTITY